MSEQQAMARVYKEEKLNATERTGVNQTLSREYWKGQLHGNGLGRTTAHARHMRPRCSIIPRGTYDSAVLVPKTILIPRRITVGMQGTEDLFGAELANGDIHRITVHNE